MQGSTTKCQRGKGPQMFYGGESETNNGVTVESSVLTDFIV